MWTLSIYNCSDIAKLLPTHVGAPLNVLGEWDEEAIKQASVVRVQDRRFRASEPRNAELEVRPGLEVRHD